MSAPSSDPSAPPPRLFPVPGRLFFFETLPLDNPAPAAIEDAVLLAVESHAPLPTEQIAYGWRADAARKTIFYYAAVREQLRQCANGVYDTAGHVVPDFMLAPKCEPGVRKILVTEHALTAVRFTGDSLFPEEILSCELPAGDSNDLRRRAEIGFETFREKLTGAIDENFLFWNGASAGNGKKTINVEWRAKDGKIETAVIPENAVWHADVRERRRLEQMRRTRRQTGIARKILFAGIFLFLVAAILLGGVLNRGRLVKEEAARIALREKEVESIASKNELVVKLDQMVAGQVPFFDALATLNHYRTTVAPGILFTRAVVDDNRQIQINGTCNEIAQANDYVDKLKASGFFKQVTMPQINTAGGRTTFMLKVTVGNLGVSRTTPLPDAVNAAAQTDPDDTGAPANAPLPPQ